MGMGLLVSPTASHFLLGVYPGGREGGIPSTSGSEEGSDCCFGLWAKQQNGVPGLTHPWGDGPSFFWGTSRRMWETTVKPGDEQQQQLS